MGGRIVVPSRPPAGGAPSSTLSVIVSPAAIRFQLAVCVMSVSSHSETGRHGILQCLVNTLHDLCRSCAMPIRRYDEKHAHTYESYYREVTHDRVRWRSGECGELNANAHVMPDGAI